MRTMLAATAIALGLYQLNCFNDKHHELFELESGIFAKRVLDVEIARESVLPPELDRVLPEKLTWQFDRVVEIYVPFDDLNNHAGKIASYSGCSYVRTIRIRNLFLRKPIIDEILKFPQLQKIIVEAGAGHGPSYQPDEVNLSRLEIDGVQIVIID